MQFLFSLPRFQTEQEPTSADPDSDEEADLVLSLETETGLLTNQHTKGKNEEEIELGNWNNWWCIQSLIEFSTLVFPFYLVPFYSWSRPFNIIIETFYHHIFRVLHDTIFYDFCNEALLRLDVFVELSQKYTSNDSQLRIRMTNCWGVRINRKED